ncbi:MAG: hypothetical protein AB7G35_08020 [Hyphomicrobiaceae bacterium]
MIENPVGTLATYWREPDYTFHPVHYAGYAPDPFADEYTKKTCLWTGNGFVMPDRRPGEPTLGSLMHRLSPSDDRADLRSATPMGFAIAVFQANAKVVAAVLAGGAPCTVIPPARHECLRTSREVQETDVEAATVTSVYAPRH